MKVIICGSRDEIRGGRLWDALDGFHKHTPLSFVITGAAPGVDDIADRWAGARGIDRLIMPANWSGRGNPAGPHRNGLMLSIGQPHAVLAFPAKNSVGTFDMMRQADEDGVPVIRFDGDLRMAVGNANALMRARRRAELSKLKEQGALL